MKKLTAALCAAIALCALMASAGDLITGTITIPGGSTNAVSDITLNRAGSLAAPAIDSILVYNSGTATGILVFAAADVGVVRALGTATALAGAAATPLYPVRQYTVGAETNNGSLYRANTVRVSAYQDKTNAATYSFGIITLD
jgi:hypothetical protein